MKNVSSTPKTSISPSVAKSTQHQPHKIFSKVNAITAGVSAGVNSSFELLQLRIENSELRRRLDDALSHTDESKSELLHLLEEQTTQTNLLQAKCDELAAGFVEIDKERRALRKSADDARQDSMRQVKETKAEYEERCTDLEKHVKMREKEVEKLADRTREQERRIEAAVSEWHDRQSKVDELEGELEELILLVDKERKEKKVAHEQHIKVVEEMNIKQKELEMLSLDLQQSLNEKEAAFLTLQLDREQFTTKNELALKATNDMIDAQKADFESQLKAANEMHQMEKIELTNTFQLQIKEKDKTIESIRSERNQLQISHNEQVAEMESRIDELIETVRVMETKHQQSCETNDQLLADLTKMQISCQVTQEEVKTTKGLLERENRVLADELDRSKSLLTTTQENLSNLQMEHTALQCEYATLKDKQSDLSGKHSNLVCQIEQMTKDYEEKILQHLEINSVIQRQLTDERTLSDKLSLQLRELNADVSNNVATLQREKRDLEQDVSNLNKKLSVQEKDTLDLHSRYQATVSSHLNEVQSMKSKHAEEISTIEMKGADIVSELEAIVDEARKALEDEKLEKEHIVNSMIVDKERMERLLHEREREILEQNGKITSLAAYAKERKEEVRLVKTELTNAKHALESTKQDSDVRLAAICKEMEISREKHQQEMHDLKKIIDEVRSELSMAKERLASDDGELERAKATLSERTNLLRDMVNQTTVYQGDYERERLRATTLEDAVQSYKRQLAEAREVGRRLEHEIHDKDMHYCDAIQNERRQRKNMESELDSYRKLYAETEKENAGLKDKISRQENYIGRLQDRDKRERRHTALNSLIPASASFPRTTRPFTADTKDHIPHKHCGDTCSSGVNENTGPNIG